MEAGLRPTIGQQTNGHRPEHAGGGSASSVDHVESVNW